MDSKIERAMAAMKAIIENANPKAVPCSPGMRNWWEMQALPQLRDNALSQLWRTNQFKPTLVGFMKGGDVSVVDVTKAIGGDDWGDARSKNATAAVQRIAALVPGTIASVFCVEAWALRGSGMGAIDRQLDKYPNLGDHPDRYEVLMFTMLHYDWDTNGMMQLMTMIEVIKVLGANPSPAMWRETKLGETTTTDPMSHKNEPLRMTGRFVFGDPDDSEL